MIACIEDRMMIKKVLTHMEEKLWHELPPVAALRRCNRVSIGLETGIGWGKGKKQ